jgi:hypothetical protein
MRFGYDFIEGFVSDRLTFILDRLLDRFLRGIGSQSPNRRVVEKPSA